MILIRAKAKAPTPDSFLPTKRSPLPTSDCAAGSPLAYEHMFAIVSECRLGVPSNALIITPLNTRS